MMLVSPEKKCQVSLQKKKKKSITKESISIGDCLEEIDF